MGRETTMTAAEAEVPVAMRKEGIPTAGALAKAAYRAGTDSGDVMGGCGRVGP